MGWDEVKKINSSLQVPLNHMIWINDYKTYGTNSYVYQDKDILKELVCSKIFNEDLGTRSDAMKYANDLGIRESFYKKIYGDKIREDILPYFQKDPTELAASTTDLRYLYDNINASEEVYFFADPYIVSALNSSSLKTSSSADVNNSIKLLDIIGLTYSATTYVRGNSVNNIKTQGYCQTNYVSKTTGSTVVALAYSAYDTGLSETTSTTSENINAFASSLTKSIVSLDATYVHGTGNTTINYIQL